MAANGPDTVRRYLRLKADRANHDDRWEMMAPFLAPSRVGILGQFAPGEKQTRGVYDSTTMMAAETMAHFIAGNVINPSQRWFGYRMRDPAVAQSDSVREWLEECRDRTLKRLAASPFYAEGPEALIDYGGFGTGFLMCEEAPQPVNRTIKGFRGFYFHAEKTGRFCIAEGADGLVDTAFREFQLTARVANEQWGERGSLPESIRTALAAGKVDEPFKFIHAIYPRPRSEQGYGAKGMAWASCWVELESKHVCFESGYNTFPAACPRYHKTPGDVYGRGRGDLAFPDTWTLNTAKRMGLEDWALKIRPPILVRSDSVFGTLKMIPGGPTSINTHGGRIQDTIMPFQTGSHPEVSHINEENLRQSINKIFFVETIWKLLETEKSEMTAFEFAKKLELLFRLFGPVYGRLEWEFLHQNVDITFDLQLAAGAFSPPPPEVFMSDGQIDIEFQNPIARAQRAADVEALTLAVNDLAPLSQMFPEIFDPIDPDKTAAGVLDIRGVPAKWRRNDDEIASIRSERHKQNQQENALAQLEQAAGAAGKAAPALKMLQGGGPQGVAVGAGK